MRTRVQSLALLNGLRIQRCCDLWCRLAAVADSALSLGTSIAMGVALKRQKKKKKEKKNSVILSSLHGSAVNKPT